MTSPARAPRPTPRRQAVPARPVRPDLRVVGPPTRRSRAGVGVVASALVVFVALFVAAVAHSLVVTSQVHLDRVGVKVRAEQEQLQREKLRLATYQSPERITREAARLGMVPADEQNWLSPGAGSQAVVTGELATPSTTPGSTSDSTTSDSTTDSSSLPKNSSSSSSSSGGELAASTASNR